MNIIIPIGGTGERFRTTGYTQHKAEIPIHGYPMIYQVLDSLHFEPNDALYIILNPILGHLVAPLIARYRHKVGNINVITLSQQTRGTSETVYLGLTQIRDVLDMTRATIVMDSDLFFTIDILSEIRLLHEHFIVYVKRDELGTANGLGTANEPDPANLPVGPYSYLEIQDGNVIDIIEKRKISNCNTAGIYGFQSLGVLMDMCNFVLKHDLRQRQEFYMSTLMLLLMFKGLKVKAHHVNLNNFVSLGTPQELDEYLKLA